MAAKWKIGKLWYIAWIALFVAGLNLFLRDDTPRAVVKQVVLPTQQENPRHYRNTRPREGGEADILYVIIHATANSKPWADAKWHDHYLDTVSNRKVSWHYSVDEEGVFPHFPDSVVCFHASSRVVNNHSIGIEICQNQGNDLDSTIMHLTRFVNAKMEQYPSIKVFFHDEVQKIDPAAKIHGKICPAILTSEKRAFVKSRCSKPW